MPENNQNKQFVDLKKLFEQRDREKKEKRDSIKKSMVKIISDYPNLIIVGEDNGAIQQEIDRAWQPLQAEIENIRENKADLTKIEKDKDKELSPIEEKANNLAMDEVLEWLQAPYRSYWNWASTFFQMYHLKDINDFCKEFEYRYVKAFDRIKKEITSNFRDTMFPSDLRDTVLDFDDDNTAQSLYFKLENLYQHYKEDLQQVPSEIVDNIKKDLKELLKYMKKIPFQNEIVEYAIERCIDHLKDQNQFDTVSTLKDFITNFLSPLSTQGFERVKESYYEVIIKENDDFLSLAPLDLESGFTEHDKNVREDAMETINQLMRIKLVAFNGNLAKSIYLEQVNPDGNSNLQSLTYSQAAIIAKIITDLKLFDDKQMISAVTRISMKMIHSENITYEDIVSLVNSIKTSSDIKEKIYPRTCSHATWSCTFPPVNDADETSQCLNITKDILFLLNEKLNQNNESTLGAIDTCMDLVELSFYEPIFNQTNKEEIKSIELLR